VSVGVITPRKKSLSEQVWLALLARFALAHSKMTVCSTSNLDEKCEWLKKENTGVAVLNSLNSISIESSDSEQHIEGSLGCTKML